jgi:[protein-PII] uridylyltransferase
VISTPSEQGQARKEQRRALLADTSVRGAELARALADQVDRWVGEVAEGALPAGWAVAAVAGYERGEIGPGSDVDVVLLHPDRADEREVAAVADRLWYPLWDTGIALSPLTHSPSSALALAQGDLVTATALLRLRAVAGDAAVVLRLATEARARWASDGARWLRTLAASVEERHRRSGEVAFLLEPDLKEGRGGLRDVHALVWARLTGHAAVEEADEQPVADLAGPARTLLDARVELHRATGRRGDRLLLQEQDAVAAALGYADADELMRSVSHAARTLAWGSDRFWWRVLGRLGPPDAPRTRWWRRSKATGASAEAPVEERRPLAADLSVVTRPGGEAEVVLADDAPMGDPTLILRTAAAAAEAGVPLARRTLQRLAASATGPGDPWPAAARQALVALLGSGPQALITIEALDRYGLMSRVLPEWEQVRAKPQRNAFHTYTVDWHLCQAALQANDLVRKVGRPDLLLVGTWLHDIGKGFPGDHVVVGEEVVRRIARRMGFGTADVETLALLERHHLLLADTATRRDLEDPRTIAVVSEAVGDRETLLLLRALTEADSLATGPSAWSEWKRQLLDQLTHAVDAALQGGTAAPTDRRPTADDLALVHEARRTGTVRLRAASDQVTLAATDRRGLFAAMAGVLSLHGLDVLAGDVRTTDDGVALDRFTVARRFGGDTDWAKVAADVNAVVTGSLDIGPRLEARDRSSAEAAARRPVAAGKARAEVLVDSGWSASATVVEVRAPDRPGLLYRLARTLSELGLDIRHAKVVTLGHEVVDVFYVVRADASGGSTPITDTAELRALRDALAATV